MINQFGDKSIFIDKHQGNIYIGDSFSIEADCAFEEGSFDLMMYKPSIHPPIKRPEVDVINEWISRDTDPKNPQRVGVLYGRAGIGKSVVMHDLLEKLSLTDKYQVLGLKSDQIEFADTDDLSKQLHLPKRLEDVIRDMASTNKRVILLIDQIDALSLSLSSNRTPLRSLLKLIQNIQHIKNVRVIISCRPYDLEYDPTLGQLNVTNKWELKEFSTDDVASVLKEHGYNKPVGNEVLRFLGNPLHLHLFLKVFKTAQLRFPLTEEDLYDQLWRKYIIDDIDKDIDRRRIIALLDVIVNHMYEKQELTIRRVAIETEYSKEMYYLLHSEILILTPNGQIQFFHQTMFDYVFARRFTEQGKNILEELRSKHQGLFIRSAVKSILSFMRASDPKTYKRALNHLLFDKNDKGDNLYRFHLRSLILSSMVYFEEPIKEELSLVETKLMNDKVMLNVFLDAINNANWFKHVLTIMLKHCSWRNLCDTLKDKLTSVGRRIVWIDSDSILDFANIILDNETEGDKKRVSDMLNSYELLDTGEKTIKIYERITESRCPLENTTILKGLCRKEPVFVMEELRENIRIQLEKQETTYLSRIKLNHVEEDIYEELEKVHPELVVGFYLEILEMILKKESFLIDKYDINYSIEISHFKRCKDSHFSQDYLDDILNKVLDRLETDICNRTNYNEDLLLRLSESSYDGIVYIALYCYSLAPWHYIDAIFTLLRNRNVLANAPAMIEYMSAVLLKTSFSYFSQEQKDIIIDFILRIKDKSECSVFHKSSLSERLENNIPLFWIDNRKGTLLNLLDKDMLKREYRHAYQELLRIRRKFPHECQLKNEEPGRSEMRSGYPSMDRNKAKKMDDDSWKSSMRAYNADSYSWDRPSLSGQKGLLQEQAKEHPEGKFKLLMDIVHDNTINLSYPIAGMKGLLESGRLDLATQLFDAIIEEIGVDINQSNRGYDLHSFLFAIDGFVKSDSLPKSVFDFICRATIEAKEDLSYRNEDAKDIYNRGINLPRGNAAYKLIECSRYNEWADDIFKTIESIATTASEFTRAAILLNFAALNFLDQNRSVKVFLMLMHDYHPALMALPVHNYNPLVYYVNYAFDDLIPFFEKALENENCHKQQVIFLWLAWDHTHKPKAKELLDEMIEASEVSRLSLVKFLSSLEGQLNEDATDYLCYLMQEKYFSENMAEKCDDIFIDLDDVSKELQFRLADTFVNSELCIFNNHSFYKFLASYAITDPIQTLTWLDVLMHKDKSIKNRDYNVITDIIIQSYNGIKSFDEDENMSLLENAINLLDELMQRQDNRFAINNFIYKLDNE